MYFNKTYVPLRSIFPVFEYLFERKWLKLVTLSFVELALEFNPVDQNFMVNFDLFLQFGYIIER